MNVKCFGKIYKIDYILRTNILYIFYKICLIFKYESLKLVEHFKDTFFVAELLMNLVKRSLTTYAAIFGCRSLVNSPFTHKPGLIYSKKKLIILIKLVISII